MSVRGARKGVRFMAVARFWLPPKRKGTTLALVEGDQEVTDALHHHFQEGIPFGRGGLGGVIRIPSAGGPRAVNLHGGAGEITKESLFHLGLIDQRYLGW